MDHQFANLNGWRSKVPHGSANTISSSHAQDGALVELRYPGNPDLGPRDRVGPIRWPVELATRETVHFGTYRGRIRFASCSPGEELVSAFFVYANSGEDHNQNGIIDNPEIDIEVLCGEPYLLWMTVWTDYQHKEGRVQCRKQTRVVDMRDGSYHDSPAGSLCSSRLAPAGKLNGVSVSDFPGNHFYELGFHWGPDQVTYFIVLENREITLWDLTSREQIPQRPVELRFQLWHPRSHWYKGGPADYPNRDGVLLVDWVQHWAAR